MPVVSINQLGGVNTYVNPLLNAQITKSVNFDSFPLGAKTKRAGYNTYLGTADGSVVNTLFNWTKNDGTTFFNYRASGSALYYSIQGTGAWTLAVNGTITPGANVGHAVLDDTLIVGEAGGSTRHTTNGTSFTDTTLAPPGEFLEQFQNRIYIGGTSSTLFFSTTNDATNWQTSGTSDSSSLTVPGAGKMARIFKVADRLVASKNSQIMYRWDGFNLVDMTTNIGPSSPYSVAQREGFHFWINRLGAYGYGGDKPQILSNTIQRQFYNNSGSAIAGTAFDSAPGVVHNYDYLVTVGTLTDDFHQETIDNAIIKYDFQKNEFMNYTYANQPTSYLSFNDTNRDSQLIFGASGGQCFQIDPTTHNDNGSAINTELQGVIHLGTLLEKKWNWLRASFNPGNEARLQISISNTFTQQTKRWRDLGDANDGVFEERFPQGSTGRFLFWRVTDASKNSTVTLYGFEVDADVIKR